MKVQKTLRNEVLLHKMALRACNVDAAVDYSMPWPARREQCIGMCNVDERLSRIYKASLKKKRDARLGYINKQVWDADDGALGRSLLCREYGADGLDDDQFAYLKTLWKIDAMWNVDELPLEALVLRPVTLHLRWMCDKGAVTERGEVIRYYGEPRFKHATRTVSRATSVSKGAEQACL